MNFTACSQWMPNNYQHKSVADFIQKDGYHKVMWAYFTTCSSKETGISAQRVTLPDEQIWDRLADVATVGIHSRDKAPVNTEYPDDYRGLRLIIDVQLVDGHMPTTSDDWEQIIALQTESATMDEEQRAFINRHTTTYWPIGLMK